MSARQGGFTFIELIVALTIAVVVAGFVATFIAVPVQSHLAQARRSELAASAEAVTRWMSRDVRRALPNSVRVATINGRPAVEVIVFTAVETYRRDGGEGDTLIIDTLQPPDSTFEVWGSPAAGPVDVVINNRGTAGQDVYQLAHVIAPATIAPLTATTATVTLNDPTFRFAAHSPNRRVFLVSPATAVIRYECDLGAGTLRRYDRLPVSGNMVALPAGTPSRLIARDVDACTLTPDADTPEHGGLLLLRLTISRVTNGTTERLRIMKQLKVEEAA
jgi:MSHA biogenesis protein MshO